jgi:GT2 family glycosyltransferase
MPETVSIGVPVYRGQAFVAESLQSIQKQTHRDIDVLISVDGGDIVSAEACEPFLGDSRFRMVVQDHQLGWAQNISLLMRGCRGAFWYYHQQDDTVAEDYVQSLLEYARANAAAAVVYCDMLAFGDLSLQLVQQPVLGPVALREIILLTGHHPAVAFRGLTRREALEQISGVRENEVENFSADTTWMASVARAGELHRLPRVLYYKRYHRDNVHTKWAAWPLERRKLAWQVHSRDMFLEAAQADATVMERRLMWSATLGRLVAKVAIGHLPVNSFDAEDQTAMLNGFLACIGERSSDIENLLEAPWASVASGSRQFFVR